MKKWLLLSLLATLAGCSASPATPEPQVDPLEQNAISSVRLASPDQAWIALDAALSRYEQLDDLYGQWRIHYLRAKFALQNRPDQAVREVQRVVSLAQLVNDPSWNFDTAVLQGIVTGEAGHFRRALGYAQSDIQMAIAHIYLDDFEQARQLVSSGIVGTAEDKAFVHYRLAQHDESIDHFDMALRYYREADDPRGVGDSLFQLAKLTVDNDAETAISLAERAVRALQAAEHVSEAAYIRAWIDAQ